MPLGPPQLEGALEGRGPGLGAQQASWGPSGWGEMPALPPLIPEGPSCLPLLFFPCLLPMPLGPTWPGGGLGGRGTQPEIPAGFPGPSGWGECPPRSPDPLVLEGPSLPSSSSSPLLLPCQSLGPTRPEGAPENGGPGLGAQQASWGLSGWGKHPSPSPDPPVSEGPSHLPLLSPLPPSYPP